MMTMDGFWYCPLELAAVGDGPPRMSHSPKSPPRPGLTLDHTQGCWYMPAESQSDDEEQRTPKTYPTKSAISDEISLGVSLLASKMARRPSREDVEAKGYYKNQVAVTTQRLARRSLSASLERQLYRRPSREDVMQKSKGQADVEQWYVPPSPNRQTAQFGYTFEDGAHGACLHNRIHT